MQAENNSEEEFFESSKEAAPTISAPENYENPPTESTLIAEQVLTGTNGDIHYSYYLSKDFKEGKEYPMMAVMPGYEMMWFGEDSFGGETMSQAVLCQLCGGISTSNTYKTAKDKMDGDLQKFFSAA